MSGITAIMIICIVCTGICVCCVAEIKDNLKITDFWRDYWEYWRNHND